jgi:hypothetical protein
MSNKRGTVERNIFRKPRATNITVNNTSEITIKYRKKLNSITNVSENNGHDKKQIIKLHNRTK